MNRMKKVLGASLAALMIAGAATAIYARNYDDVTEDCGAATEISVLSDMGIIKGTTEHAFAPDENVTRE